MGKLLYYCLCWFLSDPPFCFALCFTPNTWFIRQFNCFYAKLSHYHLPLCGILRAVREWGGFGVDWGGVGSHGWRGGILGFTSRFMRYIYPLQYGIFLERFPYLSGYGEMFHSPWVKVFTLLTPLPLLPLSIYQKMCPG